MLNLKETWQWCTKLPLCAGFKERPDQDLLRAQKEFLSVYKILLLVEFKSKQSLLNSWSFMMTLKKNMMQKQNPNP